MSLWIGDCKAYEADDNRVAPVASHDADDNFVPIAAVMLRQVVKQKTWNLNVRVCVCMCPVPILAAVTKHVCDEWRVLTLEAKRCWLLC